MSIAKEKALSAHDGKKKNKEQHDLYKLLSLTRK